jgi:proliferating cell nuclear antigen
MLEATLAQASVLKRLLDAIKELVTDANFECNDEGLNLQAMDNSHVALVAVKLETDGFTKFRCDRPMPLGVNLNSLTKVMKCAKDDDIVTLRADDNGDVLYMKYEAAASDRMAEYEMKLMDIDQDQLTIPETEYDAKVRLSSSEFARICRDLSQLGESVRIEVSKEGVRFTSEGEAANGNVLLKQTGNARRVKNEGRSSKKSKDEDEEEEATQVKKENDEDKMDEDTEGGQKEKLFRSDGEEEVSSADEGDGSSKKRKKSTEKKKTAKKVKRHADDDDDDDFVGVSVEMTQHVSLTFSLKYLVNFAKSSSLSRTVTLMMSSEVPLLVMYKFEQGYIQYFLAPKIGDE